MKTMNVIFLIVGAAYLATPGAQAQAGVDAQVPPALRVRPAEAPATGAALRAQVLSKLEQQFRAADLDGNGSLTRDEAKNFGFVATHFEAIDRAGRGAVSFDDLRAFLARAKAERR